MYNYSSFNGLSQAPTLRTSDLLNNALSKNLSTPTALTYGIDLGKTTALNNGLLNSTQSTANTANTATTTANTQSGMLDKMNSVISSDAFKNVSGAVGSIASLVQTFGGWQATQSALKEQKRMNDLLRAQYNEEVRRYNKREAERDEAMRVINDAAKNYVV